MLGKTYKDFVEWLKISVDDELDQYENKVIYDKKGSDEDLQRATDISNKILKILEEEIKCETKNE